MHTHDGVGWGAGYCEVLRFNSNTSSSFSGRLAFHGLNHNMTYYKQVEETKPYIKTFVDTRLEYYLRHFLRVLERNGGGKG